MPLRTYDKFIPRNAIERYISDALGDFEIEMDSRGLFPFYNRFRFNEVTYEEDWQGRDVPTVITFKVFEGILTYTMSLQDREKHFEALSDVYIHFFMKDVLNSCNSNIDCVFGVRSMLLDALIYSSDSRRSLRCVDFLRKCKDVLNMDLSMIVASVYSYQRDFIVSCVSERFPSWNLLGESSGMGRSFFYNSLKIESVLLLYGLQYRVGELCFQTMYRMLHSPRFKVLHKDFRAELCGIILYSRSLRLQMAIELLIGIFYVPPYPQEKEIFMNFLKVLWRAVPHPLISKIEMYKLLKWFYLCNYMKLAVLCNEYAKHNTIFPVPVFEEPRSLKHLARIQVRTNLMKVDTIGDKAIDSLDIPVTLKSYLKLKSFS